MKRVLKDTIMVVLSNAWIALFSFYQFTNDNSVKPVAWAIILGLLLVIVTGMTDEKLDRKKINEAIKKRDLHEIFNPEFKNQTCAWICLGCVLAFFVILIFPMYFKNSPVIILYSFAIILVFYSCWLYNNNLMNSLLKPLWLNFTCPIIAYYICAKSILSFWGVFQNHISQSDFISFVRALCNVYMNTIYIAALILLLYLASVVMCGIKVIIEFIKARIKRKIQ